MTTLSRRAVTGEDGAEERLDKLSQMKRGRSARLLASLVCSSTREDTREGGGASTHRRSRRAMSSARTSGLGGALFCPFVAA